MAAEAAEGHPQVAAVRHEGQRAQIQIEDHEKGVGDGHGRRFLRGRRCRRGRVGGGVVGVGGVVVGLAPPQVPAPGVLVAPHQALVASWK